MRILHARGFAVQPWKNGGGMTTEILAHPPGAGLDTLSEEPLPVDHPIRKLDNVVLTPHLGYVTEQGYRRYYSDMVEDIVAWMNGAPVRVIS